MHEFTKHELEKSRPASEYHRWITQRMDELCSTESGRAALRLPQGLSKQFVEEAYPLGLFVHHHFGCTDGVIVKHVLGNQPYDATITDGRSPEPAISYIEITQAHEGEDAFLRNSVLEQNGSVCSIGLVTKTKNGPEVVTVAKSGDVLLQEEIARIVAAIEKKAKKENYPDGTALVVAFDDRFVLNNQKDQQVLTDAIVNSRARLSAFCILGLVGLSKKTYIQVKLTNQRQ